MTRTSFCHRKTAGAGRCLGLLLLCSASLSATPEVSLEYKLKAVFLLNFSRFVHWPGTAFTGDSLPFNVCIIGPDPFAASIDQVMQGERIQGRPVQVLRQRDGVEHAVCHIAFFRQTSGERLAAVLAHLPPFTLTVGDDEVFLERGGMVAFKLQDTKVRFVVNPGLLRQGSLQVSSKLLALGQANW